MANIEIYRNIFPDVKDELDILRKLTNSEYIMRSNRDATFFVNWENAIDFLNNYDEEIALLQVITKAENPLLRLRSLLNEHPKILEIIPILVAVSENEVEFQLWDKELTTRHITFSSTEETIFFLEKTGFIKFLNTIKSFWDYIFGVKVWMDTNGRKNRSWSFNEAIVMKILREKLPDEVEIFSQTTFGKILSPEILSFLPAGYKKKKFDFLIKIGWRFVNIEVNHFDWWWSKQEIADSYRTRNSDLKRAWLWFIWNTDGKWWLRVNDEENKLLQAIKEIDFVTSSRILDKTCILADIVSYYKNVN